MSQVPPLSMQWRALRVAVGLAILLAATVVAAVAAGWLPAMPCQVADAGGVCPTCGLTRSVLAILRAAPDEAARWHQGGAWCVGYGALALVTRPLVFMAKRPGWIMADVACLAFGWVALALTCFR